MEWIKVKDRLPEPGRYRVKTNYGESVAFLTRNFNGKKVWLCPNEDYKVIEWLETN